MTDVDAIQGGLLRRRWRRQLLVVVALATLAICVLSAIALGGGPSMSALLSPLLPHGWVQPVQQTDIVIVYRLRLPRAVMAVITGAGLAMAGVAMQGVTRNPLVSPYTLGISPAAAFGASIVILLGLDQAWMVAGAFMSAMICAGLVLSLSAMRGVNAMMLILGGVGLTYLFTALTATIQFVATEQQLAAIVQWTFGSLNGIGWGQTLIAGAMLCLCAPMLLSQARALNAFAAGGEDLATALGFHIAFTRLAVTIMSVLITAAIVSFVGVIGFVGLIAPHIARMLIGEDHRWLLPFAAMAGAILVLLSDLIGRVAFAPVIIPVGIVVAYVGVPLFLHLLLSRRQEFIS